MGGCCSWCCPKSGRRGAQNVQGMYNSRDGPVMAADRVMETRGATVDEVSTLLPGYDDIFPVEDVRTAKDGMALDEVQKGGFTQSAQFQQQKAQRAFASRGASAGAADNAAQAGLCCFMVFGLIAFCIYVWSLFQTSFKLYSELVNANGDMWATIEWLTPFLLVVLLLVILLLLCLCAGLATAPAFAKPAQLQEWVLAGRVGLCGLCCCGLIFLALTTLGFLIYIYGSSGAIRASNQICRVYEAGGITSCPLIPVAPAPTPPVAVQSSAAAYSPPAPTPTAPSPTPSVNALINGGGDTLAVASSQTGNTAGQSVANPRRLAEQDIDLDLVDLEEDGGHGEKPTLRAAKVSPAFKLPRRQHLPSIWSKSGLIHSVELHARRLKAFLFADDFTGDEQQRFHRRPRADARGERRLATTSNSSAHDKADSFLATVATTASGCADTRTLCGAATTAGANNTACTCTGVAQVDKGAYCNAWTGTTPWCFVLTSAVCTGVSAEENVTVPSSTAGQIGSSGPCVGSSTSKYETVSTGKFLFLLSLIASLAAASCCCCSLICGAWMNIAKGKASTAYKIGQNGQSDKYLWKPGVENTMMQTRGEPMVTKTPLMPLDEEFRYYQEEASRKLSDATPEARRYELYGFYHQAVQGNVQGERPSFFHQDDQMKYDSWARLKGMPRNEAMRGYCNAVKAIPDIKPGGNWN